MSDRNESLGEGARGDSRIKSRNKRPIIFLGEVIDVEDPSAACRIRVRVKGLDDKPLENPPIPWSKEDQLVCFPFLPLHINIIPKKGETAKIILYDNNNDQYVREYVGPLIPQLGGKLKESLNYPDSRRGRPDFPLGYEQSINKIIKAEGVYPKKDEIALQGRDNADIIFKSSEVLIRAGKFLPEKPTERNDVNPAYIQLKTITPGKFSTTLEIESTTNIEHKNLLQKENNSKTRSDINLVSNKIYLIGRNDNSSIIKPYFSEEEEINIEDKLHPIVYGDILKSFIELLYGWIENHIHPYPNVPPNVGDPSFIKLMEWKKSLLPRLNSTNIFAGGDFENIKSTQLKAVSTALRGFGIVVPNENTNLSGEKVIRENSFIARVDELISPKISINAYKVCDGTVCKVEFDVVNNSSGEAIITIEGVNNSNDLLSAYNNAKTNLTSYLVDNNQNLDDVYIPELDEIQGDRVY